jgi:Leucine-rich repeat (LRR) protein
MPDSVIVLSLRGKGLTTVAGLGSFKNLQVLDLSDNALTTFPVEVLRLSKLLTLDLSGNPIKTVPEEIGSLTQMTRLNLRSTSITMLPAGIGKCVSLSSLDVSKNALVSLPINVLNRLPLLRSVLIGGIQQGEPSAEPTEPSPQQPDAGK